MSGLGIAGSMDVVASAIIANDGAGQSFGDFVFTENNCKVIDEEVFRYIETIDDSPDYCVIIDFGGARPWGQREFASTTLQYDIYVNFYHIVPGDDNYINAYTNGIKFTDALISYISKNPDLGLTVPGSTILAIGAPIPFARGNKWYVMIDARVGVVDNIS